MRRSAVLLSVWLVATSARADSPIADAVERGDRAEVARLLKAGVDVNVPQPDGATALHWAIRRDEPDVAKQLLAAKADPNLANRYGVRPLSLACETGDVRLVEPLIAAGADPESPLRGGETPLMTASRTGRLAPVKALLARGVNVNAKERRGQTAIMWAAAEGHADVVEALIAAGADFKTPLPSGFTPLFFAAREGRLDVVKALLKAGDDPRRGFAGNRSGGRLVAPGTSPLLLAIENGHFDLAAHLLNVGADPNDQRSGFAPLHVLTWVRKPNRGDGDDGDPAPIGSGRTTSLEFAEKLLAKGADVNLRLERGVSGRGVMTRRGATPLLLACATADLAYVRLLVERGAKPTLPNADGCTPLMAAAGVGTLAPGEEAGAEDEAVAAVDYLLKLGCDPNVVDRNGETAMHGAAYKNLPRVVELLAARGAKVEVWNRADKYGWTPLTIAEGYRPGNFKPSPETAAAIRKAMLSAGVVPPKSVGPSPAKGEKGYAPSPSQR